MYTLRQTKDVEACKAIHSKAFPLDDWEPSHHYWILRDELGTPVGYCGLNITIAGNAIYLNRSALLARVQGKGIQRRMIRVRERWGRKGGYRKAITYVLYNNHPSLVNLIKSGYQLYFPQWPWAGKDVHYFIKDL